jgi:hypothetical protein
VVILAWIRTVLIVLCKVLDVVQNSEHQHIGGLEAQLAYILDIFIEDWKGAGWTSSHL